VSNKLRVTFYVIAAYLVVFGLLFLFTPSMAAKVLSTSLPDVALNMLYGQLSLTFAFAAFLAARSGEQNLWRLILALTGGHVIIFGYQLISGMLGFAQAGPPLIINLIFTVCLFLFRK
jgi:hypothetical protein